MHPALNRGFRKWAIGGGAPIVLGVVCIALVEPRLGPYIQARAVNTLRERFNGDVTIDDFHVSLFPSIAITGGRLVLRPKGRTDVPPLISIRKFSAEAGLLELVRSPTHVRSTRLEGLKIQVPPSEKRSRPPEPKKKRQLYPAVIDELVTGDAELVILRDPLRDPDKEPLRFQIHRLTMHTVGLDRPAPFEATLGNPRPRGEISTAGQFGPWHAEDPGQTPLAAAYTLENAGMAVFRGLGGMLSSTGRFGGMLNTIVADGKTSTPDFRLGFVDRPVPLETTFDALIDGMNGNTLLTPVRAQLLHSAFVVNGGVVGKPGVRSRAVVLNVVSQQARIEDLLRLAVKSNQPPLTGAVHFQSEVEIPPGDAEVLDRMKLDGRFGLGAARFTQLDVRRKLQALSRGGQGQPENANAGSAVSNLSGRFKMANGVVSFSNLTFGVPGASIFLNGMYALRAETLDFHGTLRLEAKLSETTTGLKSVLLKVLDPLFRKKGAGAVVPIRITGTRSNPSFGLDVGRVLGGK
ncbi:MAG: AsmA-like C-terminal region-containing protein [Bryobacteraceae bacterium]